MTSTGSNILAFATTNGLSNLELTDLKTDVLTVGNFDATNMSSDFLRINNIEVDNLQIDIALNLTDNTYIILKKGTINEVILSENELVYLDGMTSNIQDQLDLESANIDVNSNNISSNLTQINQIKTITNLFNLTPSLLTLSSSFRDLFYDVEDAVVTFKAFQVQFGMINFPIELVINSQIQTKAFRDLDFNKIYSNASNITNNTTSITNNTSAITNNTINLNTAEADILGLQLKTQYMTSASNQQQTNFQGIIALGPSANWSVFQNALRINTFGLAGVVINPGSSKIIDLHSNTVVAGRTSCNFIVAGVGKITLNSEEQHSAFTNARKTQIETNTASIATNVINIATNAIDITNIQAITDYFSDTVSDFVLNTQQKIFRIDAPTVRIGTFLNPGELNINGGIQVKAFRDADYEQIMKIQVIY